ncbi:MAG: beta-ketoacyl-ACP synthase II [Rhodothermales bacterium]|nr:beta-ketoacyl-ACP synthase II [Rhodothermales bacterium]
MAKQERRVVVTGMGAVTPIGLTVDEFWDGMMNSRSGAARIAAFDPEPFETQFACELKDFDPSDLVDRKLSRRVDQFCLYGLAVAEQALRDSGLDPDAMTEEEKERVGVIFGSGIGGMGTFHQEVASFIDGGARRISPFFIPKLIPDILPGNISIRYGFKGPNYCVVSACATGNNNIGDAFLLVQRGLVDRAICGGAESPVTEMGIGGFNAMKALSKRNDDPAAASRPFDAARDGFVMGEGAGALVLEDLDTALERGAQIYAEVAGVGMSADAYHMTAPDPAGRGAFLAMQLALRDADVEAEEVDYLNMHGTSTPLGDVAETNAIKAVFKDHAYKMNLSSTKSMTGHLLGAAGAIEAVATIMAIKENRIPPTINFENPDDQCDLNYTFNTPQDREVNVGLSNAFGFGGHNTCVVFKKYR